ncbi:MAG: ATP-binding protein, partial [Flavobacteriales bacterium]|nr:ATP-binding protein [Flavobacteriales bacterium]
MTDHTASDPLADRLAQLAELPAHLRSTHLGIDTAIDRVLDAVRPWHLFAETQQRPRVVGLWGMTGTGKSTLVRSVVEHLQLTDRTFWLDAGECRKPSWLDNTLERLLEHHDGKPFVLVVDEFQHARTIKGGTEQEEPGELRRLWELLDSGRTTITEPNTYQERSLMDMADRMQACLAQGVK